MTVWDALVGQHRAVEALQAAAAGHGMSHAFLFTGPPGSGRSNAAVAFAAALQCAEDPPGCGTCHACHTVLAGPHPPASLVPPERLSLRLNQGRGPVPPPAPPPGGPPRQIG